MGLRIAQLNQHHPLKLLQLFYPTLLAHSKFLSLQRQKTRIVSNPLSILFDIASSVEGSFQYTHDENIPGHSLLETGRVSLIHPPKGDSYEFQTWLNNFRDQVRVWHISHHLYATDGSFSRSHGCAGFISDTGALRVWDVTCKSSYEAEILALDGLFHHLLATNVNGSVIVLVDSQSGLTGIFDTSVRPYQSLSIAALTKLRAWLEDDPSRSISLSWCPISPDFPTFFPHLPVFILQLIASISSKRPCGLHESFYGVFNEVQVKAHQQQVKMYSTVSWAQPVTNSSQLENCSALYWSHAFCGFSPEILPVV